MRRWIWLTVLLAIYGAPVRAQTLASGDLTAANIEVTAAPGTAPGVSIDVSGTFSGTITFACATGAQTYTAIQSTNITTAAVATTTTGTGVFSVPNIGCLQIRARMTSYSSGTATIVITRAWWNARLFLPSFGTIFGGTSPGDCSAPSFTFTGDVDTGMDRTAANTVALATNGVCRLTVDTATATSTLPYVSPTIRGDAYYGDQAATKSRWASSANGLWALTNNGNTIGEEVNVGTARPTVNTCGTGTINANADNVDATITATGAAACTMAFGAPAFTNNSACVVTPTKAPTTIPYISAQSTTSITISGLTAADNLTMNVHCAGGI